MISSRRPETWELSCLQLKNKAKDPFVVLSWVGLHLVLNRLIKMSSTLDADAKFGFYMGDYTSMALPSSFASIQAIFQRLALIISEDLQSTLPDFEEIACLSETLKDGSMRSELLIILVVAICMGSADFVKTFLRIHDYRLFFFKPKTAPPETCVMSRTGDIRTRASLSSAGRG